MMENFLKIKLNFIVLLVPSHLEQFLKDFRIDRPATLFLYMELFILIKYLHQVIFCHLILLILL